MSLPNLEGYKRLSPSELKARGLSPRSRSVETPSGQVISRRQYENLRISSVHKSTPETFGWKSWSQFQRSRNSPVYKYDMELALEANPEITAKQMRRIDSEFNQLYSEARPYWNDRKSKEYRNPNGPVANFLVYLGLRSEDDTHDVGETNARQK